MFLGENKGWDFLFLHLADVILHNIETCSLYITTLLGKVNQFQRKGKVLGSNDNHLFEACLYVMLYRDSPDFKLHVLSRFVQLPAAFPKTWGQ